MIEQPHDDKQTGTGEPSPRKPLDARRAKILRLQARQELAVKALSDKLTSLWAQMYHDLRARGMDDLQSMCLVKEYIMSTNSPD